LGPTPYGKYGLDRAADYYGVEFDSAETVMRVRRLEKCHGRSVHEWLDEGIPVGAMGTPSKMEAYRERKDSPIPWDIEDLNEDSEERNTRRIKRLRREKPNPDGRTSLSNRLRDVVSSPGQSLDEPIQRAMEDRIGDSFGDVRVHTGSKAAGTAEQINARAFTVGNHIVFNHGEYDPESAEGQRVLAHELAHVRQQTGGALSMLPQEEVALEIDPDPELEREAEETAQRVMAGGELDIQRLPMRTTEVHVQREPKQTGFGPEGEVASEHVNEEALQDKLSEVDVEVDDAPTGLDTLLNMSADMGKGSFAMLGAMLASFLGGGPVAAGVGAAAGTAGQVAIEGAKSEANRAEGASDAVLPEESIDQVADEVMRRINQQTELDLTPRSDSQGLVQSRGDN
jgi:hypothetical protein